MENKEFYINCDGIALHAKMDFPKEEKDKYPMVIVVHGLTGHSQGGAAIVLAAGLKEDCLKAIMPLAPAMMIRDVAYEGGFPLTQYDSDRLGEEFMLFGERPLSANYMRTARLLPFEDAVRNFKKPVLIVHSDTDELVPFEYSVKLQKDYENAELVTIPGDNHVFDKHLDMVLSAITKFLGEQA